jgi:hypothetical protein
MKNDASSPLGISEYQNVASILDNMSKCPSLLPPCDPQSKQQQQGLSQPSHSDKATETYGMLKIKGGMKRVQHVEVSD